MARLSMAPSPFLSQRRISSDVLALILAWGDTFDTRAFDTRSILPGESDGGGDPQLSRPIASTLLDLIITKYSHRRIRASARSMRGSAARAS